jgi:4-amino-4-deoxychorismate lyase
VLARAEWDDGAIVEGLMCDAEGRVICGTMSNLFVFSNGRLSTPALTRCGIAGVARGQVLAAAARLGIPCEVADLTRDQVAAADALLLSNALIGLWPVAALAGRALPREHWPDPLIAAVMEQVRAP